MTKIKNNIKNLLLLIFAFLIVFSFLFSFGCSSVKDDERQPEQQKEYQVVDEIAKPVIEIDYGKYTKDTIPLAIKGKQYKLFTAKASDAFGVELEVEEKLYLFYASENRTVVDIANGTFVPTTYGQYTMEFTATDRIGNKTTKTYTFDCTEKAEFKAIVKENKITSCNVGDSVKVADIDYENNNGFVTCDIIAVNENESVSIKNGEFIPRYVGKYIVKYVCMDYCEDTQTSYEIDVVADGTPKFYGEAAINKFYMVGEENEVPKIECVSYITGEPADVTPKTYIEYEGDLPKQIEVNKFTLDKAGKFKIVYEATVGDSVQTKVYESTAVDVGLTTKFNPKNYFYSESNYTAEALSYGIKIKTADNNCKVDFINPIQAKNLSSIIGFAEGNNFSTFNVYLEDSINSANRVKFKLAKFGEQCVLSVNDKTNYEKTFTSLNSTEEIVFGYNNDLKEFAFGQASVKITKTLNGEAFNGFESGYVYISYEMSDVAFDSSFTVYKINNQSMGAEVDIAAPELIFSTYGGGVVELGDIVTVDRVYAGSVFARDITVSYSIVGPDGKFVKDIKGVELSSANAVYSNVYQFKADQLGAYRIAISAISSIKIGNETVQFMNAQSYAINVTDTISPKITLLSSIAKTYKLGETFKMPEVTVTDNLSEDLKVITYIVDPNDVYVDCTEKDYVFEELGTYKVKFMAIDEAHNISIRTFEFEVVE